VDLVVDETIFIADISRWYYERRKCFKCSQVKHCKDFDLISDYQWQVYHRDLVIQSRYDYIVRLQPNCRKCDIFRREQTFSNLRFSSKVESRIFDFPEMFYNYFWLEVHNA